MRDARRAPIVSRVANFTRMLLTAEFYPGIIPPMNALRTYTAFAGDRQIATGPLRTLLPKAKACLDRDEQETVLVFDDDTGREVDFDFRGTADDVVARAMPAPPGPGRPRLGVISREVSLLPRHWDWLEAQPNGISAALRRLVEEASKRNPEKETARRAIEAASRVMTTLAGDRRGFEEASRALYARDRRRLQAFARHWPNDVRKYIQRLVRHAMQVSPQNK